MSASLDDNLVDDLPADTGYSLWLMVGCSCAVLAAVSLSYKYTEPNRGEDWKIHAIYWVAAVCSIEFIPESITSYIFTQLTVSLVGAVYPIYRSTKAVCTPDENDDKEWLQFWIVGGVIFVLTAWVNDKMETDRAETVWLGGLLFVFFWLYYPLTCGSLLFYEHITEPYLGPRLKPMQRQMNNAVVYLYQTMANVVHLYLVWIIFMFLPVGLKRIVAIAVGTVYPFICSVTAAATEEIEDDTYWLTYWAVYGCLFLLMDICETWLGRIPGFYTLVILTTIYLMLPMFRGADKVFRKILVPLAGLQELLILRDSIQIKKQMLKDLEAERATVVRKSIAKFFDGDDDNADPAVLNAEFMQSWSTISNLKSAIKGKMPFGKSSKAKEEPPTETTNLV
mmetsp:Transcript_35375/g.74691  ORF Transcript_35375/g.74691 Transcript_35375/m.74691 type:complete len:394 (-) Transcript_35375:799-1980(-)|eukprot:CAMPEP_0183747678 /NCGR_PEP_ID=MMETSP0737-20130205/67387_1 /TAXON_ID=385413 /ORGANISM="Thalassiosira miniscula, Strain CCMP1093" /LENGTH=393 /DNA_ID=CAMNT_0025983395 /DNA_START=42 /DNA_END=1223 /DNA_ORIENTATION=-